MKFLLNRRTAAGARPGLFAELAIVLGLFIPSLTAAAPAEAPGTTSISATQMKDYLTFIASDEMEGRATPSRGLDTTAKFIATLLSRWGVTPGGDNGSYFQKIAMSARRVMPDGCSATINTHKLIYGDDYVAQLSTGKGSAAGPFVYGGDGWMVKATGKDALKGLDVKGKLVIVHLAFGRGPRQLAGKSGEDYADPTTNAAAKGAAGIVFVAADGANLGGGRGQGRGGGFQVDKFSDSPPSDEGLPAIVIKSAVASDLFTGEKASWADLVKANASGQAMASFALKPEKQAAITTVVEVQHTTSQNVVGIVEGSDPTLKSEFVGLSAHYDHIGALDTPINGDRVYNGADDDGSGTTAVLATVDALSHSKLHPKRSIIFIWHMGEERGLWGSRYFTMNPTVPLKQITSLINIDMIGRSKSPGDANPANKELSGPNGIYVIGSTMMSTELDMLTRRVNDHYLKLDYDFKYDDPKDPNRFFYRSDHVNYARQGIPILFYFDGVHEDYHRLGDEVSKIDFEKMQKITRTIYQTLWELASLRDRPKVDKPKPPQLQ